MTQELGYGRVLPQNVRAETALISALLFNRDLQFKISRQIEPEDFYKEEHKAIFEVIKEDNSKMVFCDKVKLCTSKNVDRMGGVASIIALDFEHSTNIEECVKIIKKTSALRLVIQCCSNAIKSSFEDDDSLSILDYLSGAMIDISKKVVGVEARTNYTILKEVKEDMDRAKKNKGIMGAPLMGMTKTDTAMGGLEKSDFVIVAARPGQGKSVVVNNMLKNGIKLKLRICLWSLEMSGSQIYQRTICAISNLNFDEVRKGVYDEMEFQRASQEITDSRLMIIEESGVTIDQMFTKILTEHEKEPFDLIIFDHLGIITHSKKSTYDSMTYISGKCKQLAKKIEVPVCGLSQLSRELEKRNDKRPRLSDLRETGALEQDADKVIFPFRPKYYDSNSDEDDEMIIAKNRGGGVGTELVRFSFRDMLFLEKDDSLTELPF